MALPLIYRRMQRYDLMNHPTKYTLDEQKQMVTLWCYLRSPLMVGGDLRTMSDDTIKLLTNKEVLGMQIQLINRNTPACHMAVFMTMNLGC